ncbi:MAG: hypothetical protein EOO26_06815 [Comamonadaceae bacterium]|nr:MAG: hypothetical protein EOO26_06815 [Comamonadaceae bacterium]
MNEPFPARPSRDNAGRSANPPRYLSARQTDAYLMARDLVRRIRHMSQRSDRGTGARDSAQANH